MAYTNGDEIPRVQYVATAAQQIFAIPFPFDADGDIKVYRNDLLFVLGVNYVITGTNVELSAGATAGQIITIVRDTLVERSTDFPTSGPFNIVALNAEFDRLFQSMAEVAQEAERTLMLSPTDVQTTPFVLPDKAARLGRALQFNATTGAPEAGPTSAEITAAQGYATAAAASEAASLTNAGIAITKAAEASASAAEAAASAAALNLTTGSFTPTVQGTSTAGSATYSVQLGRFTRIGNLVFFTLAMTFTGHTGTGNIRLAGLPLTSANVANRNYYVTVYVSGLARTRAAVQGYVNINATTIDITDTDSGGTGAIAMDPAASIYVTGFYEV